MKSLFFNRSCLNISNICRKESLSCTVFELPVVINRIKERHLSGRIIGINRKDKSSRPLENGSEADIASRYKIQYISTDLDVEDAI